MFGIESIDMLVCVMLYLVVGSVMIVGIGNGCYEV